MPAVASGLDYIDLQFLGRPELIATAILHGAAGVALIDPGPSTTVEALTAGLTRKGIAFTDVRHILLTHIHLDHAGVTGVLLRQYPHMQVLVHERGAPHMVDPSKLLASAGRLYGADMERLWGDVLPAPAGNVRALAGGETLSVAGRELRVAYTPGHASHHVSYYDTASRIAFVGDTAGIRRGSGRYVLPPTPPPDIDLAQWRESEERILAWDPDALFLTHFGLHHGPRPHFQELFEHLDDWMRIARRLLADDTLTDEQRQQAFVGGALLNLRRSVGEAEAADYDKAGGLGYSWVGLARAARKTATEKH